MAPQIIKPQVKTPCLKKDEKILVVKRTDIISDIPWNGIKQVDFEQFLRIIEEKKQFLWRSQMENDQTYKQIIPYLIFTHQGKYFLMQRQSDASEKRLRNKYSLGIGGHIRQEDMTSASIFDWARREFHEEVNYNGNLKIKPLGILNDDSNAVGKVHMGFALLLQGDTQNISVRSELKSGKLVSIAECEVQKENLENWSSLVLDLLKNQD
ncbi:hypothetical protein KAH94_05170 [bacterium]|nr:hypothetical protein [bacterium]